MKYISHSLVETQNIAKKFSLQLKKNNIVIFNGDLGVGKTEFIRAICSNLNVGNDVSSPSFTIINQYEAYIQDEFVRLYHIDLYRVKNNNELVELGLQEILYDVNSIKFVEWAENSFGLINQFDYKVEIIASDKSELEREINIYNRYSSDNKIQI